MSDQFGADAGREHPMRRTLFGDMPIEDWPASPTDEEPWVSFLRAREAIEKHAKDAGIGILEGIASRKGLESRHYLQAWHFLRQLGVQPPQEVQKDVLGVVVEVGLKEGVDLLAAYADLSARYCNYGGGGVVWECPDASLDASVRSLLAAGREIVEHIGPWEGERPPQPKPDEVRINVLTPLGLWFGQAPLALMSNDPLGGRALRLAAQLMQELIRKCDEPEI
jgi:hypothetical protein